MQSNDPNQNPYQTMPQKPVAMKPPVHVRPRPQTARLGFFDCFFEAQTLLGSDYWLFWGLIFVGGFIGGLIPLILLGPIYCGMGLCFLAKEQGHQPSFELLFKGFDSFVNTLVPVLLYSLGFLVVLPFYMGGVFGGIFMIGSGDEVLMILGACLALTGFSVMIIGSTYIGYGWMFACFLVAEYKLEGMDAFQVSLAGLQKNVFGLLGVAIASMMLGLVAAMLCIIPFYLILPIFAGGPFICYRKIFRSNPKSPKHS